MLLDADDMLKIRMQHDVVHAQGCLKQTSGEIKKHGFYALTFNHITTQKRKSLRLSGIACSFANILRQSEKCSCGSQMIGVEYCSETRNDLQ
jgi:hypothetical protein